MEAYNEEQKMKSAKFWTCLVAGIISAVIFLPILIFSVHTLITGRVVGEVRGGTLYYNGEVYERVYENIEINVGGCLGSVVQEDGSRIKIYKLKGYPEYIYLSFIVYQDYSLYKLKST